MKGGQGQIKSCVIIQKKDDVWTMLGVEMKTGKGSIHKERSIIKV